MSAWFILVIGALVTWRVTRFIVKDDLIAGTRGKVLGFLDQPRPDSPAKNLAADKVWTLLTCPWCVGIYVSAGFLIFSRLFWLDSIPCPIWMWLGIGGLAMVPYNYLDGD